jgi:hypothetical protein
MATCKGCCHLTGAMLNLAAEAADRARIRPFSKQLRGNFCARNSIWRPAVNPIGRLHSEKYIGLGHKHLTRVIQLPKKKGFYSPFSRQFRGNFCA